MVYQNINIANVYHTEENALSLALCTVQNHMKHLTTNWTKQNTDVAEDFKAYRNYAQILSLHNIH